MFSQDFDFIASEHTNNSERFTEIRNAALLLSVKTPIDNAFWGDTISAAQKLVSGMKLSKAYHSPEDIFPTEIKTESDIKEFKLYIEDLVANCCFYPNRKLETIAKEIDGRFPYPETDSSEYLFKSGGASIFGKSSGKPVIGFERCNGNSPDSSIWQ